MRHLIWPLQIAINLTGYLQQEFGHEFRHFPYFVFSPTETDIQFIQKPQTLPLHPLQQANALEQRCFLPVAFNYVQFRLLHKPYRLTVFRTWRPCNQLPAECGVCNPVKTEFTLNYV